jgi:hypothetical protein
MEGEECAPSEESFPGDLSVPPAAWLLRLNREERKGFAKFEDKCVSAGSELAAASARSI